MPSASVKKDDENETDIELGMEQKVQIRDALELALDLLQEDIADHKDENDVETLIVAVDVDTSISRAESLRTQFREKLHELR